VLVNENRHRPVHRSRVPCSRVLFPLWMRTLCSSKVVVHPASHSFPMEMRELYASPYEHRVLLLVIAEGLVCMIFCWIGGWHH
jgi:hypothetical protein